MKVLLIYPPISRAERYSSEIGNAGGAQIPLGVYYLASYIREYGHSVSVIDGEATGLTSGDILAQVINDTPEVIGISSTTVAFHRAIEVAAEIKERFLDLPIVLGGPHVSSNVKHAMSFDIFNYGVIGEGEFTFRFLLDFLASGGERSKIEGLAYRANGEVVVNPRRARITDLDCLPFPAFDLIPDLSVYNPPPSNYKKLPVVSVITGRGCPNLCTFCDRAVFGRTFHQRSPENIAEEIAFLWKKYSVREISFVDDTFTLRPDNIRKLFKNLDDRDIALPWTCASRINTVDFELLRFMKEHGCWHVSFGIESGDEEILKTIKKRISLENAKQVIAWCRKLGIRTKGFYMIGHPGETVQTMDKTIESALQMGLDDVVVTLNTPIPGSEQYERVEEFGSLNKTDWAKFNYWRPVFVPGGLSSEIIQAKHKEFYRRFYLRPRILWRYFLSFFSAGGLRRFGSLCRSLPFLWQKQGEVKDE